ncbi:MAG: 5'/3'-nucleotidase SurE [Anaerolineaceae bacterium]|nr:5'/3'-nucleotidase SurE [Anaerolineaceae bacterium]
MHILVTNDDGIDAHGLHALVEAVKPLGKVSVFAPHRNWSACGHVKTLHRPIRAWETQLPDGTPAFTSDGAPSDCVALAMLGLIPEPIDVVVSGINPFNNIGHDITYSGTVTSAMEATIHGVPGIAFSIQNPQEQGADYDYTAAKEIIRNITGTTEKNGLPRNTLLNVNIPHLPPEQIKGYKITRQGWRIYHDQLEYRVDPQGKAYYWIGGKPPTAELQPGTDYGELMNGYVSITPLNMDFTDSQMVSELSNWNWKND